LAGIAILSGVFAWGCDEEKNVFVLSAGPPQVSITQPSREAASPATITFTLSDPGADLTTVTVQYSTGGPWLQMTISASSSGVIVGNTVTGLPTSPIGIAHTLDWDLLADIGTSAYTNIQVRMTPDDLIDGPGLTVPTTVFITGNDAPSTVITSPTMSQSITGLVMIRHSATDSTSDPIAISVEYSTNGIAGPFNPATLPSGLVNGVPTSPGGIVHDVFWDPVNDIGLGMFTNVVVRITPDDGLPASPPPSSVDSATFTVDN